MASWLMHEWPNGLLTRARFGMYGMFGIDVWYGYSSRSRSRLLG